MLFAMRFDFRNPDLAATTMADRYAAALDIAEWADRLGCVSIAVSEHHGSPDGYLPTSLRRSSQRRGHAPGSRPVHSPGREVNQLRRLARGRGPFFSGTGSPTCRGARAG